MSIVVICPSRGRPEKARDAFDAFESTKSLETTKMVFVVDGDDETFSGYVREKLPIVTYEHEGGGMGPPLNVAMLDLAPHYDITGFIGDDHRFRTPGWDKTVEACLAQCPGLAFANDPTGRNDIPTHIFYTSKVALALGWMALPEAKHLYLDNTWAELGVRAGCISFMQDIVIEHVHPVFGKASWDAGYARVNDVAIYSHDGSLFSAWIDSGRADEDAAKVREAIG